MTEIKVANVNDINEGKMFYIKVNGKNAFITKINGRYYCMEGDCSHEGGSLWEGILEGKNVICPLHGAEFDVTTGKVVMPPATENKKTYQVKIKGNDLFIVI